MTRALLVSLLLASLFGRVTSWPESAYALFAASFLACTIGVLIGGERERNSRSAELVIGNAGSPVLRPEVSQPTSWRRGQWRAKNGGRP